MTTKPPEPSLEQIARWWDDARDVHADNPGLAPRQLARLAYAAGWEARGVEWKDRSQLSDGYHTFAELYEHRHSLVLALMRALPELCWFSRRHADGGLPFGFGEWFIVGADFPTGSISYHLPIAMLALARQTGAPELTTGRPWDGHTADEVIQRLRKWAITPAVEDTRGAAEDSSVVVAPSADLIRTALERLVRLDEAHEGDRQWEPWLNAIAAARAALDAAPPSDEAVGEPTVADIDAAWLASEVGK